VLAAPSMSALRQRELRRFSQAEPRSDPMLAGVFCLAVRGWREARLTLGVANGKAVDGADLRLDRSALVTVMAFVHHVARPDRIPRCWSAQRAKDHAYPTINHNGFLAGDDTGEPSRSSNRGTILRRESDCGCQGAARRSCCSAGTDRPPTAHVRRSAAMAS
jgi:hypothetical protein